MTKEGKILKALSGFYYVDCSGEVITCRARGNFRNENITPLVGDDVKIQLSDNNTGYVVEILERKNELLRPKVANIDYSIIVVSVKDPEFSSKLLNKTICLNENSNVDIIIVFTKLDLLSDEDLNKMKEIDLLIFNKYYEVIKKWTRKLENDKNLVRMAVKTWLGPFASFELNKIEPGLYEVILPEAFEFEPHWSLDFNYDEFEKIKRYIEKVSEENCEGWSDSIEVEVEEKKMYIELMPEYHFYYDFSSNFSVSIKEVPIE